MNYRDHYERLIEKHGTWLKPEGVYTERHRKVPGNAGGEYVRGNAFYMSARAHFVAHLLLAKMTGRSEDWLAVRGMCEFRGRKSSRLYRVARELARPTAIKGGKKAGRTTRDRGYLPIAAAKSVESQRRNGFNMFSYPNYSKVLHSEISSKAGKITRDRGYLKIAGDRSFELKAGFHSLSEDQKLINARLGGKVAGSLCKEKGLGIFGLSESQRSKYGVFGGKITGAFPWWYNPETNHCTRSVDSPGEGYIRGRKKWK